MAISTLFNISLAFICVSAGAYMLVLAYTRLANYLQMAKANDDLLKKLTRLANETAKPKEADGGEWK